MLVRDCFWPIFLVRMKKELDDKITAVFNLNHSRYLYARVLKDTLQAH
jgi:hypothetical protein